MNITNEEYMEFTRSTAVYPKDQELVYLTLGLTSEAGECSGKVKKMIRDNKGVMTPEMKASTLAELGDVAWYLTRLCDHLDITLSELLELNYQKLLARKKAGTIQGSGDHR